VIDPLRAEGELSTIGDIERISALPHQHTTSTAGTRSIDPAQRIRFLRPGTPRGSEGREPRRRRTYGSAPLLRRAVGEWSLAHAASFCGLNPRLGGWQGWICSRVSWRAECAWITT